MSRSLVVVVVVASLTGCGGALEEFRAAAPSAQGVEVKVRPARSKALVGDPALMPGVTGLTAFVVNGTVALTLATIADVVATEPGRLSDDEVTWGPVTRPLWANEYTMTMRRSGSDFTYTVWGRPRGATEDRFVEFMRGTHTPGRAQASGAFVMDWTAMQRLANPPGSVGEAKVAYVRTTRGDVTLDIDFVQTGKPTEAVRTDSHYAFSQAKGGEGSLSFVVDTNYDTRGPALERLAVLSRWNWNGAGRADAIGSGGDVAAPFRFSECWDDAHARSHYGDTLGVFPTEGAATDCVFAEAQPPAR